MIHRPALLWAATLIGLARARRRAVAVRRTTSVVDEGRCSSVHGFRISMLDVWVEDVSFCSSLDLGCFIFNLNEGFVK